MCSKSITRSCLLVILSIDRFTLKSIQAANSSLKYAIYEIKLALIAEDIVYYIAHPILRLPLARESPDAIQMIAQGNNRRFFPVIVHLPQSNAGQQTVTQAAPTFRVVRQAAFMDKTLNRRSRATLEKPACAVGGRFA